MHVWKRGIHRSLRPARSHRGLLLGLALVLIYLVILWRHFDSFPNDGGARDDAAGHRQPLSSSSSSSRAAWDDRGQEGGHADPTSINEPSGSKPPWWAAPFSAKEREPGDHDRHAAARQQSIHRLELAGLAVGKPGAEMPDPLVQEFVARHGPDWELPPKPPLKPEYQQQLLQLQSSDEPRPVPDPFPLLSMNPPPVRDWVGPAGAAEVGRDRRGDRQRERMSLLPSPSPPLTPPVLRVPEENRPPSAHFPEKTPLLIGFTRNWPLLLQCVVSYIAAGWPAEDIYVVENTGVMNSNRDGRLSLQNPFYLNHTQLGLLGVNVIMTPTLLTFAQLQNFYLSAALERDWPHFFWSHMDLVVFSLEEDLYDHDGTGTNLVMHSLYARATAVLRRLRQPGAPRWANHFFSYDRLTLVNRDALVDVGGWDTHIPFYATDCDMYSRLKWAGYGQEETRIGLIFDVGSVLHDVAALLRVPGIHASFTEGPLTGEAKVDVEQEEKEEVVEKAEDEEVGGGEEGEGQEQVEEKVDELIGKSGGRDRGDAMGDGSSEMKKTKEAREKKEGRIKRHEDNSAWEALPKANGKTGIKHYNNQNSPTPPSPNSKEPEPNRAPSLPRPPSAKPDPAGQLVQVVDAEATRAATQEAERVARVGLEGEGFVRLVKVAERMQAAKHVGRGERRNAWQLQQAGGLGEPFYRDPAGFERGVMTMIMGGRAIYADKWGHRGCEIDAMGIRAEDAWRLARDWEGGMGFEGGSW